MPNTNYDDLLNVSAQRDEETAAWVAKQKENRALCYDMLDRTAVEVAGSGAALQKFLDVQSRFDRYTSNNALLIMTQRPDATRLGDKGYWYDQRVYIKRQERRNPVLILEPGNQYARDDNTSGQYFNAKEMYDISQTTASREARPPLAFDGRKVMRALTYYQPYASIQATDPENMPVEGAGAYFSPEEHKIYACRGLSMDDMFRALSVEVCHTELSQGEPDYGRADNAMTAYCSAYLLCKKYGIDTQDFTFDYGPEVFAGMEPKEVRGELSKIQEIAGRVSERMSRVLEPERSHATRQRDEAR